MTLLHSVMTLKGTDAGFGEAYIRHCGEISRVTDDVLRKVFVTRPDFNKGTPIGKHVPGPCGQDYLGEADYYLVLGTGDQVFKRILSAMMSTKEHIVFIVQSPAEAWWRENAKRNPRKKNNGNRVCSEKFASVFNTVLHRFPDIQNIVMIKIETHSARIEFAKFNESGSDQD
jgi:hypothetical protein